MKPELVICIAVLILFCSVAHGDILAFDEVPSGTVLFGSAYGYAHRVSFSDDFRATDHTGAGWGPPHSGANVLTSSGSAYSRILFGYYTFSDADPDAIQAVDAYFSTELGAMVTITAYHWIPPATSIYVTSVVIGASGESWNNRHLEIAAGPGMSFERLEFAGVNSQDDLLHFCADDMTIIPVPEPGGLIGLASGLGALALPVIRRRGRFGVAHRRRFGAAHRRRR